jgi:hypothetical protein
VAGSFRWQRGIAAPMERQLPSRVVMRRCACLVSLILLTWMSFDSGARSPTQDKPSSAPVGIEMRNVRLHVSTDAVLNVKWLKGSLVSPAGHIPVFDDQNSYSMQIDDAEMAVDASSLTALVNRAFDYKGSALSDLRMTLEDGHLVQRGTLKKGISVPFTIEAILAVTADGRLAVHPTKVKTAGIPTTKFMSIFGVELDDLLKSRPDRGINFKDNDLFLDATRLVPSPRTNGRLTNAFIRGNTIVQVFGKGAAGAARTTGNYIWFRGASIRFGRLTMSEADLKLIDMDPGDPFDFYSARYNEQLVAGYSKNTRDHALRTYMPDFADLSRRH